MRRMIAVGLTLVAFMMVPVGAMAVPPEVTDSGEYDDYELIPAGEACDFEVEFHEVGSFRETTFYTADGSVDTVALKIRGTTTWTSVTGQAVDHWAWTGTVDVGSGTFTRTGNVFNTHAGAGGIVINTSGRLVFDFNDFSLTVNGPSDSLDDDSDALLCDALAP